MLVQIYNGPTPTTAALVPVTTGTSIKTLLQIKPSSTKPCKIVEWGISFEGFAAAEPVRVELCETDVAATVTAFVNADFHRLDAEAIAAGDLTTNLLPVGTTSCGHTSSGEGSIGDVRLFDAQLIAPTNQYVKQFPLGREPFLQVAKFMRIRVHAPAAVDAICYVTLEL